MPFEIAPRPDRPGRDVGTAVRDGHREREGVGDPEVEAPAQKGELSRRVCIRALPEGRLRLPWSLLRMRTSTGPSGGKTSSR
jgi:hypothetical protein